MKWPGRAGSYDTDTQMVQLTDVLQSIADGRTLFPRYGRAPVWSKEARLRLLESILLGIPIGALTVWRTRAVEIAVMDRLGPIELPARDEQQASHDYVLDGERRLTTLYFSLFGAKTRRSAEELSDPVAELDVYYDLRTEQLLTREDMDEVPPHALPLAGVARSWNLVVFQRRLLRVEGLDASSANELLVRSDEVARAIKRYTLPLVVVTSEDLDLVTRTFQLVHSPQGPTRAAGMVHALTWSASFDLSERLDRMKEGRLADLGWGEIEDSIVLRACKVLLGLRVHVEDTEALSRALEQNPDVLTEVEEALVRTASFLREMCGVGSPEVVPFPEQILLLAAALRPPGELAPGVLDRVRDWVWITTYAEVFRGPLSDLLLSRTQDDLLQVARGVVPGALPLERFWKEPPARKLLPRFDFRQARSKGAALLLALQGPRDPSRPEEARDASTALAALAEDGSRTLSRLVTSNMATPELADRTGARVLLLPEAAATMRTLLARTAPPPREFLASHIISDEALHAFKAGEHARFVELREADLNRLEQERFDRLLERLSSDERVE